MAIETLRYPPHKLAMIFPRPSAEDQDKLTDHIRRNGLQEPVILYEGSILDGVSRATSCKRLGQEPRYCEFMNLSPEIKAAGPLAFVAGRNMVRRHLRPSQLAMVAAELIEAGKKMRNERTGMPEVLDEEAQAPKRRGRPPGGGKEAAKVAKAMGVSTRSVERAAKVLKDSPKKAAAIKEGRTTVTKESKDLSAADKKKVQRAAAIARIELVCGKPLADAVDVGSRLKTHTKLMEFTAQPDEDMLRQAGLIEQGWSLEKAKRYRAKNLTKRHTLDDLFNRAASNQNKLIVDIDGWRVVVHRVNPAA